MGAVVELIGWYCGVYLKQRVLKRPCIHLYSLHLLLLLYCLLKSHKLSVLPSKSPSLLLLPFYSPLSLRYLWIFTVSPLNLISCSSFLLLHLFHPLTSRLSLLLIRGFNCRKYIYCTVSVSCYFILSLLCVYIFKKMFENYESSYRLNTNQWMKPANCI